jgi:hypothetical protein
MVPLAVMQQAPVGGGAHSVLVHCTLSPRYTPFWAVHWSWVSTTQNVPLGDVTQQAPVGVGLGQPAPVQVVPSPRYVPPRAAQSLELV